MSEEEFVPQETDVRYRFNPTKFAVASLLIIFFLYQLVGGGLIVYLFGIIPSADQTTAFRVATMVAEIMFILIPAYFLTRIQTMQWKKLLRVKKTDWYILFLAVVGLVALEQLLEVYMYLQGLIPLPAPVKEFVTQYQQAIEQTYRVLITAHSPLEFVLVLLIIAVTPAICEETLFRGLVQGNFDLSMSRRKAIVWTGLIFAMYHLDIFTFVALCGLGIYLSYLVSVSESIIVPMAAHFTNNFVSALVLYVTGKDSVIAPSGKAPLSVGYIIGWSLLLGLIFATVIRQMNEYTHNTRKVTEQ